MDDKRAEINREIDKPMDGLNPDWIESQVDELFSEEGYTVKISKREIRKSANSIIRQGKNKESKRTYSLFSKRLATCMAVVIIVGLTIAVSANTSFIADGIKWLNDKFNIYTEVPSDSDSKFSDDINNLFNNNVYKLPRSIPDTFSATDFYTNQRSKECTDICFQMIGNQQSMNFIISDYTNSDAVSATIPSVNTNLRTQLQVGDITVSVFNIDEAYTAYYICGNTAYQISGNMPYDDFIDILKSIN